MASVNKAILVGRLGRDPEVRYTPSGTAVANFSMATDSWTNRDGEKESRTEWHRIVAWGRLAEICGEYLAKGQLVYIEGRIQTREWEDQSGNKRQTTEIVASSMQMLGSSRDANQSFPDQSDTDQLAQEHSGPQRTGGPGPARDRSGSGSAGSDKVKSDQIKSGKGPIGDDIPF